VHGPPKIDSKRASDVDVELYILFVDLTYGEKESFHTGMTQCKHFVKPFEQVSLIFAFQPPDYFTLHHGEPATAAPNSIRRVPKAPTRYTVSTSNP
jgi:hypothetical protein